MSKPMRVIVLFLMAVGITPIVLLGQNQPPMSTRQAIANALNTALANNQSSVTTGNAQVFDGVENACLNLSSLQFTIVDQGDQFLLKRLLRAGHTLGGPLSHPLVEDLNRWLDTVWAMDLTQIPEFNDLAWSCGNPNQRFFREKTSDPGFIQILKDATGESAMLAKSYIIDGVAHSGAELLSFQESGPREAWYITDAGTISQPHRRLLSSAYLKLTCPNNGPSIEIKFTVRLHDYSPNCGIARGSDPHIELTGTGMSCTFIVSGSTTDEKNEDIFRLYQEKEWTINPDLVPPNFNDPDNYRQLQLGMFDITDQAELRFRMPHSEPCGYNEQVLCKIVQTEVDDEYCEVTYCKGGTFGVDALGHFVYTLPANNNCGATCTSQVVPCVEFCDYGAPELPTVSGVIKTEARTFSDQVDVPLESNEPLSGQYGPRTLFERGIRGRWRPEREYAYRTNVKSGSGLFAGNVNAASERNYNDAGTFDMQLFSWKYPEALNTSWLNVNTVTVYSRNGETVEETNILGIQSAARYGHNEQVPTLVAKNSSCFGPYYDSFEDDHFDGDNGNGEVTNTVAHSGSWSFRVPNTGYSEPIAENFFINTAAGANGMVIRVWTKYANPTSTASIDGQCPVSVRLERLSPSSFVDIANTSFRFIARTGEWSLYEHEVNTVSEAMYHIRVTKSISAADVWVDDFRLQPQQSEMVCYAYDTRTLKPVVIFDDQHFGTYYQYNGQGQLVRTIRETERGFRTVEEAQYHTPGIARNYASSEVGTISTQGGDVSQSAMRARPVLRGHSRPETVANGGPKIDLFDAEFGLDRRNIKVFGIDAERLGDKIEELKELLQFPAIERIDLPGTEKLRMIEELVSIEDDIAQLENTRDAALDSVAQEGNRRAIAIAGKRRSELLQSMGMSEEEAREVVEEARRVKEEIDNAVGNVQRSDED